VSVVLRFVPFRVKSGVCSLIAITALVAHCLGAANTAQAARAQNAQAGWLGFGVGAWPGPDWRPYSKDSPFNQPIGRAPVHPDSDQLVANALRWGAPATITAGTAGSPNDYGHPVYYAQPTDPVYVLHATEPWGHNSLEGMRIRVPAGAQPAAGTDGHMTIVMPDGWEYDLWRAQVPSATGQLVFAWGGRVRIDGSGLGGAATAAHFGGLAGVIRPEELASGHVDHALFIVLRCTGSGTSFGYGARQGSSRGVGSYVYPAAAGGGACGTPSSETPPLGARFRLAISPARIARSGFPRWKRAILDALARYGGFVSDTGGPGFALMMQSSATYTSFGAPDRLVQVARGAGVLPQAGRYALDLASGVDWQRYLRIVAPPTRSAPTGRTPGRREQTRSRTNVRSHRA
jgi:hypothetical protein